MIIKDTIKDFFEHTRSLRDAGKAVFDIDDVCKWSYFFIDENIDKLIQVGVFLEDNGYKFIGILEPDAEDEDQDTFILRADRIGKHTIDSLDQRNQEL